MPTRAAVILAGGSGTRLWPLSRAARPKQLLRIVGDRSLLALAYERVRTLFDPGDIYVVAVESFRAEFLKELPELPPANYLGEPCPRDTAAAIALAAATLEQRRAADSFGVFTADHVIRPVEKFGASVLRGFDAAEANPAALVTFGIRPSRPATAFGYVERGAACGEGVHRVTRFTEKPDAATAAGFLSGGRHAWNSGMFCWRTAAILDALRQRLPATHDAVRAVAAGRAGIAVVYPALQRISIDYAVMEKHPDVLMVDMDVDWLDVGSWPALREVLPLDADGNALAAPNAVSVAARGCTLVGEDDHLIAAFGVEDLVIVHSPDATLVCRRADAERLKEFLAQLETLRGPRYA